MRRLNQKILFVLLLALFTYACSDNDVEDEDDNDVEDEDDYNVEDEDKLYRYIYTMNIITITYHARTYY